MRILALSVAAAALGLSSVASAAAIYNYSGGNFSYTEDFEGWSAGNGTIPDGSAATHYWNQSGGYQYSSDWWSGMGGVGSRLWMASQNYNTDPWTTPGNDGIASLKLADLAGVAGLESSNIAGGLKNVTFKADVAFSFERQPWWIGPDVMGTKLWLLNEGGDGYMGLVMADGRLSLFSVAGGSVSASALVTGAPAASVATNAMQHLSLSVIDGQVTLTLNDSVASATASSADTSLFTRVAVEGFYVNEQHNVDNIVITGSTVPTVPEAASLSLLGLGGLSLLLRSRRK